MTDSDAPAEDKKGDDAILAEARERYQLCYTAESDQRDQALEDLLFLAGEHWDPKDAARREQDGRPCLTNNLLPAFLHQVTNDQRQNKPGIKVHPVDDHADEDTAKIEQGLIRHIEYSSNAAVAYDTAVNSAAAIGIGWFQVTTKFCNPKSFDQDIIFKRIRNSLSVLADPLRKEIDGSDMQFCFIQSLMARSEFEREYPKAEAANSTLFTNGISAYPAWILQDSILVCEYYRLERERAELWRLDDGTICYADEAPAGITASMIQSVNKRQSYRQKVMWYKLTACDVLERTEIMCEWIPVFQVIGDELDIEGRVQRSGLVRWARDPSRMYDYWMTAATEEVAMRNKTPYIGAAGQFEGREDDWANANVQNFSYLEYNPVTLDGNLAPAPVRQPMTDVPTGVLAMAMHAHDNIKATTGLFDSSLGARGNATSGRQEIAQQRQGDVANFHYTDNLNITIRHAGRCILSMIPHYYDGDRIVRIMGEDDSMSSARINQQLAAGEQQKNKKTGAVMTVANDLTLGDYDITVRAGPSYDTVRQEATEFFTSALTAAKDPGTTAVLTYLAMKNQDMPGSDEAAEMLKALLPPQVQGIASADDGEEEMIQTPKGPLPVSQAPAAIAGMEQHIQGLEQQLQEAEVGKQQLEQATLQLKGQEVQIKAQEAETGRIQAQADMVRAQKEASADPGMALTAEMQFKAEQAELDRQEKWREAQLKAETDFAIEEMKQAAGIKTAAMSANAKNSTGDTELAEDGTEQPSAGFAALSEQVNAGLAALLQAQQEGHQRMLESHAQLLHVLSRPKKLIRDPVTGRATGAEIDMGTIQ